MPRHGSVLFQTFDGVMPLPAGQTEVPEASWVAAEEGAWVERTRAAHRVL